MTTQDMDTSEPMDISPPRTGNKKIVKVKSGSQKIKLSRDKQFQEEMQRSIQQKEGRFVLVKSVKKSPCWQQFQEI